VRNEADHLGRTIESMTRQTVLPALWVMVNDGSTDNTRQLIDGAARQHSWIQAVHRSDRGFRKAGGGVIEAFYEGFNLCKNLRWDFVVKFDGDLSFDKDYFEKLLAQFSSDPQLGIASGVYLETRDGVNWGEIEMPAYHAAGASKMIRRSCWEQIGGFIAARGWDTVDEIRAMTRGWRTGHFRELQMKHWKVEGTGIGHARTKAMQGEIYYLTGGGNLFFLLKVLYQMKSKPFVVGGLAMLWGCFHAALCRRKRLVTNDEAKYYRALLNGRLLGRLKGSDGLV
jgi:biofilm PGA synthesis N-glycosyltransferase PgaC